MLCNLSNLTSRSKILVRAPSRPSWLQVTVACLMTEVTLKPSLIRFLLGPPEDDEYSHHAWQSVQVSAFSWRLCLSWSCPTVESAHPAHPVAARWRDPSAMPAANSMDHSGNGLLSPSRHQDTTVQEKPPQKDCWCVSSQLTGR